MALSRVKDKNFTSIKRKEIATLYLKEGFD